MKEVAHERLRNARNDIRMREMQRKEAAHEYREFKKVHNLTKFNHEKIEEQY